MSGARLRKLVEEENVAGFIRDFTSLSLDTKLAVLQEQDFCGKTIMGLAAELSLPKVVEQVVDSIPPAELCDIVAIKDKHGDTPLHIAAYFGEEEILKYILSSKLTTAQLRHILNIKNNNSISVHERAVAEGHLRMADTILDRLQWIESEEAKNSMLREAVESSQTSRVEAFMNSMSKVELYSQLAAQDKAGNTAVHIAAHYGYKEMIELMIQKLEQPDLCKLLKIQNGKGFTILLVAVWNKNIKTVILILDSLPPAAMSEILQIQNKHGATAFSIVVQNGVMEILAVMVRKLPKADLYRLILLADNDGDTAMHCAASGNQAYAAVFLLTRLTSEEAKNVLQVTNNNGFTPIEYANSDANIDFVLSIITFQKQKEANLKGKSKPVHVLMQNLK
ncbi:hypothetical protein EB796_013034 [Bugula neritina]|uniref:Uncharacterized protein n=1 Tax=Bugula neritina TaxID=10212 RepID=A0A7J7JSN2_BUGNE|nr:hypothetical protein EB796_013034 [Bugula neritina]